MGRDAELAEVDHFLEGLNDGSRALAIVGDAGIGKTTLCQEAVARARDRGLLVLASRPAVAEAKLSFSGLADLLSGVDAEALAPLPAVQRRALEVALMRAEPGERPLDPRLVGTSLLSLLRTLAARGGVLLFIDDQQWLDAPTQGVLAFAVRRLEAEPVGVLCTLRPGSGGLGVLSGLEHPRVRQLRLGPLERDELVHLIADRVDPPLPRSLLTRIADAAHGNPFYALEMARIVASQDGREAAALPVPEDVRALAGSRVSALSSEARASLLIAAVLAAPDAQAIGAAELEPAEDVGLVRIHDGGRIEFTHPLFAAAIYSSASSAQRRDAHRRAAGLVTDREQRARHLASAAERPDAAIAAELDAAAADARARGAPAAAAELVELALRQTPRDDAEDRATRMVSAAGLHLDAGDAARARALLGEVRDKPAAEHVRAEALRLRAELASRFESFGTALETALEALEATAGEPAAAAAIELDVAFYRVNLGDVGGAMRHAEAALGRAEIGGDRGVLADALAVSSMVNFLSGEGLFEDRIRRALALEDRERRRSIFTGPRLISGVLLLWTGRLREGVSTLLELQAERAEQGVESDPPAFTLYLVWAYLWLGETERAAEVAVAGAAAADLLRDRGMTAMAQSALALVDAQRGDLAAVRARAATALALFDDLGWVVGAVWPLWAVGFAELSAGDPAAAHAALAPLTEMLPATGLADPVGLVFLPDEIESLIALGELARAEPLVELLHRLGVAHDRPWAKAAAGRCAGLLAHARGALEEATAALERALAEHNRVPMPFERARTLLVLGRTNRRRKQWGASRAALREALELFEQSGAPLWAEAARSELARAGERGADHTELTPTERRVAELAASGLSNQEVAERAFLTVKGVEANLTRAYRKLGIRSRTGLPGALRDLDDEPVSSGGAG